jgi:hypothetical protein
MEKAIQLICMEWNNKRTAIMDVFTWTSAQLTIQQLYVAIYLWGHRGSDHMVVGFITTYTINH